MRNLSLGFTLERIMNGAVQPAEVEDFEIEVSYGQEGALGAFYRF